MLEITFPLFTPCWILSVESSPTPLASPAKIGSLEPASTLERKFYLEALSCPWSPPATPISLEPFKGESPQTRVLTSLNS